ncbi:MAG: PPOX class F420-dependent oxidoreductase [Anaerolineales bacterium]|jgi:PPOX class probable F420-dependent enzyme|nr:PPOX class F420-dependent oxidoreductase [Anaerolineales bacterium]MBX3004818.1 PPOX class F420-dependent oxidoreductase [Anaerolineales bacterium]
MLNTLPEAYRHLLADETKAFAWIATVDANHAPQLTAVWFNTDGEHILFGTSDKTAKFRNLSSNPQIAVAIVAPENPYQYIQVRGRVEITKEGAAEHLHALSRKYTGQDFNIPEGQVRVLYKLKPEQVTLWPPQA